MVHKAESPGGILLLEASDPDYEYPIYELWDDRGHLVAWVAWPDGEAAGLIHFMQKGRARLEDVTEALARARARHIARTA